MLHVGLDIHSTRITICVLGETGQVVHRAQVRTIEGMLATLKALPDRFEVCYEASCGYGHYHDLLRPLAARVVVAHLGQLRLIRDRRHPGARQRPAPGAVGPPRRQPGEGHLAGRVGLALRAADWAIRWFFPFLHRRTDGEARA